MPKSILSLLLSLLVQLSSSAAKVDTVAVYSASMHKHIKAVVISPNNYDSTQQYPVVYMLHGYSGNYASWAKIEGVTACADKYNLLLVCPDGGFSSWYWDSPVDASYRYETHVATEVVNWVDTHYATLKKPQGRAITGLSMGGHGALYLAIKHPLVFGAAGSMSGGVDIRPFPNNWDIAKRLGKYAQYPTRWQDNTIAQMLHLIEPGTLQLVIDCGVNDFFFAVNENLHQQMLLRNIPHDYITRPGGHTTAYWTNAVAYQLLYMHRFFTSTVTNP